MTARHTDRVALVGKRDGFPAQLASAAMFAARSRGWPAVSLFMRPRGHLYAASPACRNVPAADVIGTYSIDVFEGDIAEDIRFATNNWTEVVG